MSNFVPARSWVQVPGEKNAVLQRSQIMVAKDLEVAKKGFVLSKMLLMWHFSRAADACHPHTLPSRSTLVGQRHRAATSYLARYTQYSNKILLRSVFGVYLMF